MWVVVRWLVRDPALLWEEPSSQQASLLLKLSEPVWKLPIKADKLVNSLSKCSTTSELETVHLLMLIIVILCVFTILCSCFKVY